MRLLTSLLAGLLFGTGLIVSGMANPQKVVAFLDLGGQWDPSLAFVMGGAIIAMLIPTLWAKRRRTSLLGAPMQMPTRRDVDPRLIGGATLFGMGWGIAGICPGPAVVLLPTGHWQALTFFAAMVVGMEMFSWLERRKARALGAAAVTP
ncbi:DUF6691 family protein [Sinimarinibacterium sp. NLF-5-8]|uniref:DUF6691 family protein n=1 Tax=Sinimarinibacterium sp. NLF-5-8 TaxID=2698684 RepID=UPI00137C20A1|nr:DUF6691 family protein [Sinimarinibacterium sp. NLF-5-8]QHS11228.1 YeeE/YedE family protein [Sinimarinibacterium sp. NLF-5-8]